MFWVAFQGYNGGKAISLGAIEQAEAEAYGMHGYPTASQAEAKPNSVNALEKAQVNAWVVAANDITGNAGHDIAHAAKAVGNATGISTGINAVGQFFNDLTNPHMWLRIGEGILGILLIATAVSKLAGGSQAAKIARKLPLVP